MYHTIYQSMEKYYTGSFNAYGITTLPPTPSGCPLNVPNGTMYVENRPSCMTHRNKNIKLNVSFNNTNTQSNQKNKKGRMWMFSAYILTTLAVEMKPTMSLDVNNALPGI